MKRINFNIKDRKTLTLGLCLILVCVFTLTVAYSALSAVLTIQGNARVSAADWDIYLNNPIVTNGSATTDVPVIKTSSTLEFETTLNMPGDFYEFVVDVVNAGDIDAMIENVVKTPDLTTEQAKFLKYEVSYQNGESINTKQLVAKESFVRLKVRVEFRKDITASDLPTASETLNLAFTVNYVQSDETGSNVTNNGVMKVNVVSGDGTQVGNEVCIKDECFYVISSTDTSVTMLSKYNLYVGSECASYLSSSCTPYGTEATGRQEQTMIGYFSPGPGRGITTFSSATHQGEYYNSYNGSIVEEYVNTYGNYLTQIIDIIEIRLIKAAELETLGCDLENKNCDNSPSWLYSTKYWCEPYTNDAMQYIWGFSSQGLNAYSRTATTMGVRPVIVISKDYF